MASINKQVLVLIDNPTEIPFSQHNPTRFTTIIYNSKNWQQLHQELNKQQYGLIMAASGFTKWNAEIQKWMLEQYNCGIPFIFFPYGNISGFEWPLLTNMFPLQPGSQAGCKADTTMHVLNSHHPIMRNIVTFGCPSAHRTKADAKPNAAVYATWEDGVPLVAERNNVVSLNFCIFNYHKKSTDCNKMILQTILYLLNKNDCKLQHTLFASKAYLDVQFV